MKNAIIRLTLYAAIAMVPVACGSRKVATDISINKTSQDTKSNETIRNEQKTTTNGTEANTSAQTNNSEAATVTTVKKYDPTSGVLVEERNTISNRKKSGTKNTTSNRTFNVTDYRLTNMERTITTKVTQYSKDKSKETDTNNKPLYWMLFGVGSIAVLTWGVVRYLKK